MMADFQDAYAPKTDAPRNPLTIPAPNGTGMTKSHPWNHRMGTDPKDQGSTPKTPDTPTPNPLPDSVQHQIYDANMAWLKANVPNFTAPDYKSDTSTPTATPGGGTGSGPVQGSTPAPYNASAQTSEFTPGPHWWASRSNVNPGNAK